MDYTVSVFLPELNFSKKFFNDTELLCFFFFFFKKKNTHYITENLRIVKS